MRETVSLVVAVFTRIVHGEVSSCHLGDTIVDSLTGVDGSFEVSVLKGQHGAAGLLGLVAGANVDEDAEVDVRGYGH